MNFVDVVLSDEKISPEDKNQLCIELIEMEQSDDMKVTRRDGDAAQKIDMSFNNAFDSIKKICKKLQDSFTDINNPDKINIELNFGFTLKGGEVLAVILNGEASASLKVALEWNNNEKPS